MTADQIDETAEDWAVPRWQVNVMASHAALQARLRELIAADQDDGEHL